MQGPMLGHRQGFCCMCSMYFNVQSFFGGLKWHLLILPWGRTAFASGGSGQDVASWWALPSASGAAVVGSHAFLSVCGVTSAFYRCPVNSVLLFLFSGIKAGFISFHITQAFYQETSVMSWKTSRDSHPPAAVASNHLIQAPFGISSGCSCDKLNYIR